MKRYYLGLMIAALFITLFAIPSFSEGNNKDAQAQAPAAPAAQETAPAEAPAAAPAEAPAAAPAVETTVAPGPAPVEEAPQPKELSIYGEVQNADASTSSLSIQYYDYDSDEEKAADVIVNKDTRIENAATLTDIKKGDWADVTYAVVDGKNIAKSIMVEKEEEPSTSAQAPSDSNTAEPSE